MRNEDAVSRRARYIKKQDRIENAVNLGVGCAILLWAAWTIFVFVVIIHFALKWW